MASPDPTGVIDSASERQGVIRRGILDVVGALRAEHLGDRIFDVFAEPPFFAKLESPRSCVLKGGRGTGKTTLLRCLSYQGQYALHGSDRPPEEWDYFGFFWRIDTGQVSAFSGPELSDSRWTKVFGHYVNLELVDHVVEFLGWAASEGAQVPTVAEEYEQISVSLNLPLTRERNTLANNLRRARQVFEARLNNIADSDENLGLSVIGNPVKIAVDYLRSIAPFRKKKVFFLIDEYENLLDYQQDIFNTLVKHAAPRYAFKIGVKELGFRRKSTLNPHEQLGSPADYDLISIADELAPSFPAYATRLVESRLHAIVADPPSIPSLFEKLTPDDEALKLGVSPILKRFRRAMEGADVSAAVLEGYDSLTPLQQLFVASTYRDDLAKAATGIRGLVGGHPQWLTRYRNYSHALLFSIRAGKPGRHKYYAGWQTICRLANTNIRFLVELVALMLERHVAAGGALGAPVSAEIQTDVAHDVAKRNIQDLERDSDQAASLVRLVLSLGRIFEVLAADPIGHTPEITQFYLPTASDFAGPSEMDRRIKQLLDEAVNSLAIVRYPGSKLQDPSRIRSYDYALHPLYSALFEYSSRRKRKIEISEEEFLALVNDPKWAINRILLRQKRDPSGTPLPDQLKLFSSFYA